MMIEEERELTQRQMPRSFSMTERGINFWDKGTVALYAITDLNGQKK